MDSATLSVIAVSSIEASLSPIPPGEVVLTSILIPIGITDSFDRRIAASATLVSLTAIPAVRLLVLTSFVVTSSDALSVVSRSLRSIALDVDPFLLRLFPQLLFHLVVDLQTFGTLPEAVDDDSAGVDVSPAEITCMIGVALVDIRLLDVSGETPSINRVIGSSDAPRLVRQAIRLMVSLAAARFSKVLAAVTGIVVMIPFSEVVKA